MFSLKFSNSPRQGDNALSFMLSFILYRWVSQCSYYNLCIQIECNRWFILTLEYLYYGKEAKDVSSFLVGG